LRFDNFFSKETRIVENASLCSIGQQYLTMRKNLPRTFSVLKFRINLLNFSLKNISQFVKKLIFVYFILKISKYLLNSLNI
jgi:hypothetical protein